jgi:hypothetical protein
VLSPEIREDLGGGGALAAMQRECAVPDMGKCVRARRACVRACTRRLTCPLLPN